MAQGAHRRALGGRDGRDRVGDGSKWSGGGCGDQWRGPLTGRVHNGSGTGPSGSWEGLSSMGRATRFGSGTDERARSAGGQRRRPADRDWSRRAHRLDHAGPPTRARHQRVKMVSRAAPTR